MNTEIPAIEIPTRNMDTIPLFCRAFDKLIHYKNSLEHILEAAEKSIHYNPVPSALVPNSDELKIDFEGMSGFAIYDYIQRVQKKVLREASFMLRHTEYTNARHHVNEQNFEFDGVKKIFFTIIYTLTSYRNPAYRDYGTIRHSLDLSVPRTMPESGIYLRIVSILPRGMMPLFEIRTYHTELFKEQAEQFKAKADELLKRG